jgi:hypothetical protein
MDDLLEPSSEPVKKPLGEDVDAERDAESSGDEEDGGLDWTKLLYVSPVIVFLCPKIKTLPGSKT